MESIMTLREVCASYGDKTVLQNISMEIPRHRITSVIGPSGCGKTTLLHCMNGLLRDEAGVRMSGQIFLGDRECGLIPGEELRRRVGLLFQNPSPFPFSIYKNMTYAPRYYGIRDKDRLNAIVEEKLRMTGLYEEVKDELKKSAMKLSGGQQQRLCIARALTVEPEVLLMDEPCSALDVKSTAAIEKMLLALKEQYTIVIVTHNIAQARRISDFTSFLFEGRLVESGESKEMFQRPRKEKTRAFLEGYYG